MYVIRSERHRISANSISYLQMLSWVKKLSGDEPEDPNKPQQPPASAGDQQPSEKPAPAPDAKKDEEERLKKEEEEKKAAAATPAAPPPSADEIRRKRLERFGGKTSFLPFQKIRHQYNFSFVVL